MLRLSNEVALKYARVLFGIAKGENLQEKVSKNLTFVVDLFNSNKELKDFLENPCISPQAKKEALEVVLKDNVEKMTLNFILLLVEKRFGYLLPSILENFNDLLYLQDGFLEVVITTARVLSDQEYENIARKLSIALKQKVLLEKKVDEAILGGMILKIDDKLIDGSVLNKLKSYKNLLNNINTNEKVFVKS